MKKILLRLLPMLLFATLMLTACFNGGENENTDGYRVTLVTSTGATVEGANPVTVKEGGNAKFKVKLDSTCVFRSATVNGESVGHFKFDTGEFTVGNVTSDMRIDFEVDRKSVV